MLSDRTTSFGSSSLAGDILLVFPGRHKAPDPQAVSYTHLTLPTILRV